MYAFQTIEAGVSLQKAGKALIMIHGRGTDPKDFIRLAEKAVDSSFYIVAPTAQDFTWYPYSFRVPDAQNDPWLKNSIGMIDELVNRISETVPKTDIFIVGFSQGACIALEYIARHPGKMGGVIAFTGGLTGDYVLNKPYSGNLEGTKIFIGNGDGDLYIPVQRTRESKEILEKMGGEVLLKIYPGRLHSIDQSEIEMIRQWLFGNPT